MKLNINSVYWPFGIVLSLFLCITASIQAQEAYTEYNGRVLDKVTNEPLVFVNLAVANSNISTVTNTEGNFTLKVPSTHKAGIIIISLLGYEQSELVLSNLEDIKGRILLTPMVTELNEVNVTV
ncbi:MAG: carboxypeptidase-like regulatory domain-containing protein, partial [Flavobacteriaceae bacterium]|nr:carboxypeptidase-like regulatory domain-containing protein [Flavobacteriaceae bacterium]